jgi:hypothetical protein
MRKTKTQRGDGGAEVGSGKKKSETKKSERKLKTVEINKKVEMKAAKSSTKDGKTTKKKGKTSTSSKVKLEKIERNQSSPRRQISPQMVSKVNRRSISPQVYRRRPEPSKVSAKTERARTSAPFFVHKEATRTAPSHQSKFSDSVSDKRTREQSLLSDEMAGEPESGKGIADPVVMSDTCIDSEIDFCLLPYLTLFDEFFYHIKELREHLGGSRERADIQPGLDYCVQPGLDYSFSSSADSSNEDQK